MKHRWFKAALLCGTMFFGLPSHAHAEPISTAIGLTSLITGLGASAAVAGAVGGALVTGALVTVANFVQRTFFPTATAASNTTSATGTQVNVQYGAAVPRDRIFGTCATAGQLVYWNLSGPNNQQLDMVFAVGDGPHDSLVGMYANGNACTFGGVESPGTVVNEFTRPADGVTLMWVKFFQGYEGQAADAHLIATSNPTGRWTSNSTLSGISYVRVTMNYEPDIYSAGLPSFLFVIKGARLYDPRLDGTNGGTGPHRWSDKTTWEWSDNPAVGLYNHQRGLWLNNELIIGEGLAPQDLIVGMYAAAANDCDGAVALAAGGTEKRYRVNMNVGADKSNSQSIQAFLDAMSGQLLESAGAFGPVAGVTQTIALPTLYDTDLIQGASVTFAKKRSRADLINAVFGSYTDPTQQYTTIPFPPRTSTADESEDGERLSAQLDFPQIQSGTQAQRCGEIARRLSRSQAAATITVGFKFAVSEPGDWLTWASVRYGTLNWRIDGTTINADETVTLTLREISSSVFAWNNGLDELSPTSPGNLPGYGALATTVSSFALVQEQINGANGLTIPALLCTWTPVTDQSITAVDVQYRIQGTTLAKQVSFPVPAPSEGQGLISEAIQAGTIYEARATIETIPNRAATWTSWIAQTAPPLQVVATSNETLLAKMAALSADIKYQVTTLEDLMNDKIDQVSQQIAAYSANDIATNWMDKKQVRSELVAASAAAAASISILQTVQTSDEAAFAAYQITVAASFGSINASVTSVTTAQANTAGSLASFQTTVATTYATLAGLASTNSNISTNYVSNSSLAGSLASYTTTATAAATYATLTGLASTNSTVTTQGTAIALLNGYAAASYAVTLDVNGYATGFALVNGGGGVSSFTITTAKFQIALSGSPGSAVPVFTTGLVGGVSKVAIRGDMIVDGSITTQTINAGAITAVKMAAASVTAANGAIDSLAVKVFNIGDAAVTAPFVVILASNFLGTGVGATIFDTGVSGFQVDSTGLGTSKFIYVSVDVYCPTIFSATNIAHATNLTVNGTSVANPSFVSGQWLQMAGAAKIATTNGVQNIRVIFSWNSPNTGQLVGGSPGSTMRVLATIR